MDILVWNAGYCKGSFTYQYKTDHTGAITSYNVQGKVELDVNAGTCAGVRIIIHEILHAVGFQHVQQRPDRDQYIKVNWNNIEPSQHSQFEIKYDGDTLGLPYDCGSVMHYNKAVFSYNGRDSVTSIHPDCYIPADSVEWDNVQPMMSPGDVEAVRILYCPGSISEQSQADPVYVSDLDYPEYPYYTNTNHNYYDYYY